MYIVVQKRDTSEQPFLVAATNPVIHATIEVAEKEAKRLTVKEGHEYVIFGAIRGVKIKIDYEVTDLLSKGPKTIYESPNQTGQQTF